MLTEVPEATLRSAYGSSRVPGFRPELEIIISSSPPETDRETTERLALRAWAKQENKSKLVITTIPTVLMYICVGDYESGQSQLNLVWRYFKFCKMCKSNLYKDKNSNTSHESPIFEWRLVGVNQFISDKLFSRKMCVKFHFSLQPPLFSRTFIIYL